MLKKVKYTDVYQNVPAVGRLIHSDIKVIQFINPTVTSRYIRCKGGNWVRDILMIKTGFRSMPEEIITSEEMVEQLHKAVDKFKDVHMYMIPNDGGMVVVV